MGSEWRETTLGDFAPFNYGKGLPKRSRNTAGNVPVYGSNGITGFHDEPLLEKGIIIGRKGSIGEVEFCDGPFWPIDTTFYVEDSPERDLRFTYYLLKSLPLQKMNSDSAVPGLNRTNAHSLVIQVPSLNEQKRIAHILGTLDDKIELNQRMNETLEGIARAVFTSWFVDFDPVRAKMAGEPYPLPDEIMALFPDELVESELGLIPKGWEVKSLSHIANFLNGTACQRYSAKPGEPSLPVLKIKELRSGYFDGQSDRASMNIPEKYIVHNGDIIFSWSGSLLVNFWTGGKGFLNQHLFNVTSQKYSKWFYYSWVKYHLDEFQRIAAGKATTMGHIKRHHLDNALVITPDPYLMRAIDIYQRNIIDELVVKDVESRILEEVRNSLLEKLIS
jgi:type I restriction enzyme S subunit